MKCVGCGYCCMKAPCGVAVRLHGTGLSRCPHLKWKGSRYVCLLMVGDSEVAREYRRELFAGIGCCSGMNSWRKDVKPRRGEEKISFNNPLSKEMQLFLRCLGMQFVSGDTIYLACTVMKQKLVGEGWEESRANHYTWSIWQAFIGNQSKSSKEFMG